MSKIFFIQFAGLLALILSIPCHGKRVGPVSMKLVTEQNGIIAGEEYWIGWSIKRDNGWHTYWKHPGDVGVAPSIKWSLPDGFSSGELIFCFPEKVKMASIRANGNYGDTLFLTKITVPAELKVGEKIIIHAEAAWLACSQQCLPGFAKLSLEIEVVGRKTFDTEWHSRFEELRNSIPMNLGGEWKVSAIEKGSRIELSFEGGTKASTKNGSRPVFFCSNRLIRSNGAQFFSQRGNVLQLRMERSDWAREGEKFLSGLVYRESGWVPGQKNQYIQIKVPLE